MTTRLEQIFRRAESLPSSEQDAIADELEALLDAELDRDAWLTPELRQELDRRLAEIEQNPNNVVSWEHVQEELRARRLI